MKGFFTGKKIQFIFYHFWIFILVKIQIHFIAYVFMPVVWLVDIVKTVVNSQLGEFRNLCAFIIARLLKVYPSPTDAKDDSDLD